MEQINHTVRILEVTQENAQQRIDNFLRLHLKGFPKSGLYNASKAAVSIFLESLRIELKPKNIKVITVRPRFIRTPMTDKNEFYMPLLMDTNKAAGIILKGIKKEKRIIQFPLLMTIFAELVRLLPTSLFEYLAGKELPGRKD